MYEALNQIHKLANERLELYMLAGNQNLSSQLLARLHEINARLPALWDQHRREYAAGQTERSKAHIADRRAA